MVTDNIVLKVMADYDCFPLWRDTGSETENVDPEDLSLGPGLTRQLMRWAQDYDDTLDRDNPSASGFADDAAETEFYERGRLMARQLSEEVAGRYHVTYVDQHSGGRPRNGLRRLT